MNLTVSFFIHGHLRESKQITTPCTIGRSSQSGWVLTHPFLSRKHCILFDKDEKLYLNDEDSLNGTQFKGMPVEEPVQLQLGDEFTVGRDLKFRISAPLDGEIGTDRHDFAGQTTIVYTEEELQSHQSTVMPEEPTIQRKPFC